MKLRIQGNSLRLRLTRTEVTQLHDSGHVESSIQFAPGRSLTYALEGSPHATSVTASFDGRSILVTVSAFNDGVGGGRPSQHRGPFTG